MAGPKFRFLFDDFGSGYRGYCCILELELMENGSDLFSNSVGTASASSTYSTNVPANAIDNGPDVWHSAYNADETAHWWRFDFDNEPDIDPTSYTIQARNDSFVDEDTPIAWRLQKWVVDEWITIHQVVDEALWGLNEKRTFNIVGGPRFRFRFDDFHSSYRGYCYFTEIELMVSGSDVLDNNDGLAEAKSSYSTPAAHLACDDNDSTGWHSASGGETTHWWRFSFDALDSINPTSYSFRARNDGFAGNDTPIGWALQEYNYDTWQWDDIHVVTGEPVWSANEKRTFYKTPEIKNSSFFLVF